MLRAVRGFCILRVVGFCRRPRRDTARCVPYTSSGGNDNRKLLWHDEIKTHLIVQERGLRVEGPHPQPGPQEGRMTNPKPFRFGVVTSEGHTHATWRDK